MADELTPLARWRKARGFKQAQEAKGLGVSAPTYCEWERGTRRPSLPHAIEIELRSKGAVPIESFGYKLDELAGAAKLVARRKSRAKAAAQQAEGGAP